MRDDNPPTRKLVPEEIRRMIDGSVDAAVVVDDEHNVLHCNTAYEAYTGTKPRALRLAVESGCQSCHGLFRLEICEHACLMRRAVAEGRPLRMDEVRARRPDGEEVTLIVSATPLHNGIVVETYRDVTAESRVQARYHALLARERDIKKQLERAVDERTRELKEAQEQLVRSEKLTSLGRLVAGIAHELNNPINFVFGNVHYLGDYFRQLLALVDIYESATLPPAVVEAADAYKQRVDFDFLRTDWERLLRSVRAGAERTAEIVAHLKTFSRPQVGKVEDFDLVAGLETTLNLLAPLLRDGIRVEKRLAPLPRVRCRGGQIQQVFMNLLTNGIQACGASGTIVVEARPDGGGVSVAVRDSGPGVPESVRGQIFDPFFTTKDVGEGTGLGLAISSRIVKAHGGRLELVSPPGTGAEFVVWLPLEPPAVDEMAAGGGYSE